MTPDQIISTVMRMPLSPAEQQRLLRSALAGNRWALLTVRLHAVRQRLANRPGGRWFDRLFRQLWK